VSMIWPSNSMTLPSHGRN